MDEAKSAVFREYVEEKENVDWRIVSVPRYFGLQVGDCRDASVEISWSFPILSIARAGGISTRN
jgi:hypothetical protein